MGRRQLKGLFILVNLGVLIFLACGGDDGENSDGSQDVAAVEDVVMEIAETDSTDPEQVDFWLGHMSDEVIENFFGTTREDCAANAVECIGEPTVVDSLEGTKITGDTAVATIHDLNGSVYTLHLTRGGDTWQVTDIRFGPSELPEGVTAVEMELDEYQFSFNESEITDGDVGFLYENAGEETHEVLVLRINDAYDLDAVIDFFGAQEGGEELPDGVEEIFFLGFAPPGGGGIGYSGQPYPAGRYALACFFPDPDGVSHASLGMEKEFTIPG